MRLPSAAWTATAAVVLLLLLAGGSAAPATGRAADEASTRRADGVVLTGLDHHRACPGGYHVEDGGTAHEHAPGHEHGPAAGCSHGPDPAPAGVDVRHRPSTAELHAREDAATGEHGGPAAAGAGSVPCYGDGTSGRRLQAVYAVASDRPDRYAAVLGLLRGYAAVADQAYAASAARNGGVRHLRWVTDTACALDVAHVVLSPSGDDSLSATRSELAARGFARTDRKYVVWSDATTYCGIAYVDGDARPDASNPANDGPTYARIDTGCWGGTASVAAHEIAHMLGAVSLAAPHSNGAWHCTDEYDRLCYDDGSGASLTFLCASSQEPLLDCNGDDYFNVAPPPGSWLATHWNLAGSAFLETAEPVGWTPPPTSVPPPSTPTSTPPAPAPAPAPTTTTSTPVPPATTRHWTVTRWQGRLTAGRQQRRLQVDGDRGDLTMRLTLRGAERLRVTLVGPGGRPVTDRWVRSGTTVRRSVAAGPVRVVVRGRPGTMVSLRVGRWSAG